MVRANLNSSRLLSQMASTLVQLTNYCKAGLASNGKLPLSIIIRTSNHLRH